MPVGEDVLRAARADNFETRQWAVIDQVLPRDAIETLGFTERVSAEQWSVGLGSDEFVCQ